MLEHIRRKAEAAGGGSYQTLINDALRDWIARYDAGERAARAARGTGAVRGCAEAPARPTARAGRDIHRKVAPRRVVTRDDSR